MAATEAQKRASKKYQAGKIASLACRMKIEDVEAFKIYCAAHGKTVNAVLSEYVESCINKAEG